MTDPRPAADAPLARLIQRLSADGAEAGDVYEALRRLLCRYFETRGRHDADLLADIVLDRLAQKLDQGTEVDDVSAYARGIARLVLLEVQRRPAGDPLDFEPEAPATPTRDDAGECLETCLSRLDASARRLVLGYYAQDGRARIERRQALAAGLGVSSTALRLRMLRLRMQLEHCITRCRTAPDGNGRPRGSTLS